MLEFRVFGIVTNQLLADFQRFVKCFGSPLRLVEAMVTENADKIKRDGQAESVIGIARLGIDNALADYQRAFMRRRGLCYFASLERIDADCVESAHQAVLPSQLVRMATG